MTSYKFKICLTPEQIIKYVLKFCSKNSRRCAAILTALRLTHRPSYHRVESAFHHFVYVFQCDLPFLTGQELLLVSRQCSLIQRMFIVVTLYKEEIVRNMSYETYNRIFRCSISFDVKHV